MRFDKLFIVVFVSILTGCSQNAKNQDEVSAVISQEPTTTPDMTDRPIEPVITPQKSAVRPVPETSSYEASFVPSYDIQSYCEQVSEVVGGSYVIEKGCRDQEAEALSKIRNQDVPDRVAKYCDGVGQVVGGSYMIYYGCLIQELDAARQM